MQLQSVQNATARLITGTRRRDRITLVLHELHYPSESVSSSNFKVACLVRQSLFGQAPLYLADDCCLCSTALGALCGQLTFRDRLAWRLEHSADGGQMSALCLLDLTAAFDTVDHELLLHSGP